MIKSNPEFWNKFRGVSLESELTDAQVIAHFELLVRTKKIEWCKDMWNTSVSLQACVREMPREKLRSLVIAVDQLNDDGFKSEFRHVYKSRRRLVESQKRKMVSSETDEFEPTTKSIKLSYEDGPHTTPRHERPATTSQVGLFSKNRASDPADLPLPSPGTKEWEWVMMFS